MLVKCKFLLGKQLPCSLVALLRIFMAEQDNCLFTVQHDHALASCLGRASFAYCEIVCFSVGICVCDGFVFQLQFRVCTVLDEWMGLQVGQDLDEVFHSALVSA